MKQQLKTQPEQKEPLPKSSSSSPLQATSAVQARTHPLLRLQRAVGNQAVQHMVHAKERDGQGQQSSPNAEPNVVIPSSVHNVLSSPGQPLAPATRSFMEPRFGQDFSHVRVHTDAQSAESTRQVNALAYTVGNHVAFGAGQYAPETNDGKRLIAHELTHVVQQGGIMSAPLSKIGSPTSASEQEASSMVEHVEQSISNQSPSFVSSHSQGTLQRQADASASDDTDDLIDAGSLPGGIAETPDAGQNSNVDQAQQQQMPAATTADQNNSPPWYKPWLQDFSFSPGDTLGYQNVEPDTISQFDTNWKKNALDTALLSVVVGLAVSVAAKRLKLPQIIAAMLGAGSTFYRSYQGWQVQERIYGEMVQAHNWYGRYRMNILTGHIEAVDFKGRGPSQVTLVAPFYYEERLIEGEGGKVLFTYPVMKITIPGIKMDNAVSLPEYSFGSFD